MSENQPNKSDIQTFIGEGIEFLKKNLESCPSFDPSKPYEEKK